MDSYSEAKGGGENFWEVEADNNDSWGWKNILKVRDKIKERIVCKIGNGRSISMWYDNWCQLGPLYNYISHRDLYDARLDAGLKVFDMISNGVWNWPSEWVNKFNILTEIDVPNLIPNKCDGIVWVNCNGMEMDFAVKNVCRDLSNNGPKVIWWKLVWFSQCVPKLAFILWLVMNNILSTLNRLQRWGNYVVNRCCLCKNECEDLEHLFFKCEFSRRVWNKTKCMAKIHNELMEWNDIIQSFVNEHNGNNIDSVVKRLILAASVYCLWNERNSRIFKDNSKSAYK